MGLQPALQTTSGRFYPISKTAALPGQMGEFRDPQTDFGKVIHRTPYGTAWTEEPSGRAVSATGGFTLRVRAATAEEAGRLASQWQQVIEQTARVYLGARYLTVVTATGRSGGGYFGGPLRELQANFEFLDDLWRLDPQDTRPTRYPVESDPGDYPLGMLRVLQRGDGVAQTEYLGGVSGTPIPITLPYTGVVLNTLELTYDDDL